MSPPVQPPVAVIGVGHMGAAMAARLLDLAWPVIACDVVAEKVQALSVAGAMPAATPGLAAAQAAFTLICVVDAAQTRDVLFGPQGVVAQAPPGHCVLLCPTIGPDDVAGCAQRLAEQGIAMVDAPMSGGPARARSGSMSLMLAGAPATLERCHELVQALSDKVFVISSTPGDAARTKLVNNLLAAINLVGAAEALALAEQLGLNLEHTLAVIEQSSGQSWIGSDRLRRALAGDQSVRAHTTLLAKDSALAVQAARGVGFSGPLGEHAQAVFARAIHAGLGKQDDAAVFELLRRKS